MGNLGERIRDWFSVMRNDPVKKKKFVVICTTVAMGAAVVVGVSAYSLHNIEASRRNASAAGLVSQSLYGDEGYNEAGGLIADIDFSTILGVDSDGNPIYASKGLVDGVAGYDMFGAPIKTADLVATGRDSNGKVIYGNYSALKIARIRNIRNDKNEDIDYNSIVGYDADGNWIFGSLSNNPNIIGYDANGNAIPKDSVAITGKTEGGLPIYDYSSVKVGKNTASVGANGLNGANGKNGAQGLNGSDGINGTSGANGTDGIGQNGANGTNGANGAAGANGANGANGTGTNGKDGINGVTTVRTIDGTNGTNGADGANGAAGANGANGAAGINGTNGTYSTQETAAMKSTIATLQEQLRTLQNELATSKADTAELRTQNLKQQSTIQNYLTKVSQLEEKIFNANSNGATADSEEVAELLRELNALSKEVDNINSSGTSSSGGNYASAQEIAALKTTIASLQSQLTTQSHENSIAALTAKTLAENAQKTADEASQNSQNAANAATDQLNARIDSTKNDLSTQISDNQKANQQANDNLQKSINANADKDAALSNRVGELEGITGSMDTVVYRYSLVGGTPTITFSPKVGHED